MSTMKEMLAKVRHLLPSQAPIKDFIHHNTLHAFQHLPFHEAVLSAHETYKTHAYMPLQYYRDKYSSGALSDEDITRSIHKALPNACDERLALIKIALFKYVVLKDELILNRIAQKKGISEDRLKELMLEIRSQTGSRNVRTSIRPICEKQLGDWNEAIHPILFRTLSAFLDQGITLWHFPGQDLSFLEAVKALAKQSLFGFASFINPKTFEAWLAKKPSVIIEEILGLIVGDKALYETYIAETLLAHAGWSGIVNVIEERPQALLQPRRITLEEFLAFKLILEWEFIKSRCSDFISVNRCTTDDHVAQSPRENRAASIAFFLIQENLISDDVVTLAAPIDYFMLARIWQEALEGACYQQILSGIHTKATTPDQGAGLGPTVQAVFCLDDRECSMRRHLEEIDPSIATFSWAGFFGLDFYFQSLNDAWPIQMCPPLVTPKHFVRERPREGHEEAYALQKKQVATTAHRFEIWREASSSLLLGFLATSMIGQISTLRLFQSLFHPQRLLKAMRSGRIEIPTELELNFSSETGPSADQAWRQGFTPDEMALRVENVLKGIGITTQFAPLVIFLAHGSSSVNNPHFAAYDCGACSGKPGAPNARTFAQMANLPEVRRILREQNIDIPSSTLFVGGYHDTATDDVTLFDLDKDVSVWSERINAFMAIVERAKGRNAKERCRRFAIVSPNISESDAIREVQKRSVALFEPRPELGHATNVSCVIGRRKLTRGLFLDRRAFLNSYDPTTDSDGAILIGILSAIFPVCGGINLEYYFSRVDPAVYGCGTKLSHNVCALIGVCNGIDDDLRTGLPVQMTEIHDPLRLLVVIEQDPAIIMQVLDSAPSLKSWVEDEWVKLAAVQPDSGRVFFYVPNSGFTTVSGLKASIPQKSNSLQCYEGLRENAPIAAIG